MGAAFFSFSNKHARASVICKWMWKGCYCTIVQVDQDLETLSMNYFCSMVLHRGSTRLQTATPPTTRSTLDQHHLFQKHYSGFGSCWGSCMSMGDCCSLLQGSDELCSSSWLTLWQCPSRETQSLQFSHWKATFAFEINGKISQPSRQNVVKPL